MGADMSGEPPMRRILTFLNTFQQLFWDEQFVS